MQTKKSAAAEYQPCGFRPKAWVAVVNGEVLGDRRGGAKRFTTEAAALAAAIAAQPRD